MQNQGSICCKKGFCVKLWLLDLHTYVSARLSVGIGKDLKLITLVCIQVSTRVGNHPIIDQSRKI